MPEYYDGLKGIPDFSKRMTALREMFEETNILIGDGHIESDRPLNEVFA